MRDTRDLTFHPVDEARWPELIQLFAHHSNPAYCRCTRWRAPSSSVAYEEA